MSRYPSRDEWFSALQEIARSHHNISAVRDYDGWTQNWLHETPADAYYSEYPEHRITAPEVPRG